MRRNKRYLLGVLATCKGEPEQDYSDIEHDRNHLYCTLRDVINHGIDEDKMSFWDKVKEFLKA